VEITVGSIWGLLPTPNELVEVDLTGPQLIEVIESRNPLVAGLTGGNCYDLFRLDADPTYLELDWRLPAGDDLTPSAPRP
jgi:2',3'-cyclic-nucleotide 2'-phosphodiesterase (5'-nucleotidase family)